MYVIKVGPLYLTYDGSWSPRQKDALRVHAVDTGINNHTTTTARVVKLVSRSDNPTSSDRT